RGWLGRLPELDRGGNPQAVTASAPRGPLIVTASIVRWLGAVSKLDRGQTRRLCAPRRVVRREPPDAAGDRSRGQRPGSWGPRAVGPGLGPLAGDGGAGTVDGRVPGRPGPGPRLPADAGGTVPDRRAVTLARRRQRGTGGTFQELITGSSCSVPRVLRVP